MLMRTAVAVAGVTGACLGGGAVQVYHVVHVQPVPAAAAPAAPAPPQVVQAMPAEPAPGNLPGWTRDARPPSKWTPKRLEY